MKIFQKIRRCRQSGSTLLETALIFPLLLTLVVGIIDFSRLMNGYLEMTRVAYEATRSGGSISDLVYTDGTGAVTDNRLACPISEGTTIPGTAIKKCPLTDGSFSQGSKAYSNRVARLIYEGNGGHFPAIAGWRGTIVDLNEDGEATQRALRLEIAVSYESLAKKLIPYGGHDTSVTIVSTAVGPFLATDEG